MDLNFMLAGESHHLDMCGLDIQNPVVDCKSTNEEQDGMNNSPRGMYIAPQSQVAPGYSSVLKSPCDDCTPVPGMYTSPQPCGMHISPHIQPQKLSVSAEAMGQKTNQQTMQDLAPSTIMITQYVQDQLSLELLKALFDTGSTYSFIHRRCLPPGATPSMLDKPETGETMAGTLQSKLFVRLKDMNFPEFSRTRRFDGFIARVFDTPCRYDIILGRNFLSQFQVDPCFSTGTTKWLEMEVPMKPPSFWNNPFNISQVLFASEEEKGVTTPLDGDESIDDHDPLDNFAVDIKESKYEEISPD
jgi:hypothetical protein